jgi:hypothetical protein
MTSRSKAPIAPTQQTCLAIPPDACAADLHEDGGKPEEPLVVAPRSHLKERKERRPKIDPRADEPDYKNDEIEFMMAMDQYKRDNRRPFPTWSEALEVLGALGYRKAVEPAPRTGPPPNTSPKANA